ncbi:MAG: agmatinase [Pseudomonadota bacterium]
MRTPTAPLLQPRFMGVATFMRLPYQHDPEGLDIALLGVPYDGSVTNRAGTRHGPRALRDASSMTRMIHHRTRVNPFEIARIADIGDVPLTQMYSPEETVKEIEAFVSNVVAAGAVPLSAGGDHSIAYPLLKAVGADRPVALIQIDAHADTLDDFQGSALNHGSPFRRALEAGVIVPEKTIQVGIRGSHNGPAVWDYSAETGMKILFMEDVVEMGLDAVVAEIRERVGDHPVYLTFDIDALDPAFAPGTGTPEIGGFTTREALKLVRGLRGLNYIGADLVEVAPPFDSQGITALAGMTLMYEMLCHLAESQSARRATS